MDLMYVSMLQTFVELSRQRAMLWTAHSIGEFPELDPDLVLDRVFAAEYKNRRMIVYKERSSLHRKNTDSEVAMRFLDDSGKTVGVLPPTAGLTELFEEAYYQNREPQMAELDKVVAALTELTKTSKAQWSMQPPERFPDIDPDVLLSSVFQFDYRGRRFVAYKEEAAGSTHKNIKEMVTLQIVDASGGKIKDLRDARGREELFTQIQLQTRKPDTSKLDSIIDSLVQVSIGEVVQRVKLEAERLKAQQLEAERLKAEKLEAERLEAERLEAERKQADLETARSAELQAESQVEPQTAEQPAGVLVAAEAEVPQTRSEAQTATDN